MGAPESPEVLAAPTVPHAPEPELPNKRDIFEPGPHVHVNSWAALWASVWPSLRFFAQTEVHVYSFAVAANVLLSFFPFLLAITLLCRWVFHWNAAVRIIFAVINQYFPPHFGVQFESYLLAGTNSHKFSWLSVFLLLFTANGIFVPLEVAFNRIWRVRRNRTFLRNQVVSLILIFLCGALILASICLTTLNVQYVKEHYASTSYAGTLQVLLLRFSALPITMLLIFLVYWILPNKRIPVKRLIPASIAVGALLELLKYVNLVTWPYLNAKLQQEVPPFVQSVSIVLWSFAGTMILLAGAEWSARVRVDHLETASAEAAKHTPRI